MLFPGARKSNSEHRVVITGAGIVTALGQDWTANAEGFRTGRTAFRDVRLFDVSRQRAKRAAEVDLPDNFQCGGWSKRKIDRLDRAAKLLLIATEQAWQQSGWSRGLRLPIVLGTTSGGMSLGEGYYRQSVANPVIRRGQAARVLNYQAQRQALDLAEVFSISGPVFIIANACASGANALGHAWHLLRSGSADRVLAGGYDAISQLVFAGFDSLQALSTTCCRPFDVNRDGLSLGEGAAIFALETLESARSQGRRVLGELAGYGAATDVHHLTQPHPQGDAAYEAMCQACRAAQVQPAQIIYLNAHGTGTPLNDSSEALAIRRWARESVSQLAVSSTKASIGHLLGAAGAVEAAVCLMALQGQWLPPTTTVQCPEPDLKFDLVQQPRSASVEFAISNSFGFGGANASLVLRRWS